MILNYTSDPKTGAKRLQIACHGTTSTHEQCDPRRAHTYRGRQLFHLHPEDAKRLDERKNITAQYSVAGRCLHDTDGKILVEFIDGSHHLAPAREFYVL